MQEKQPRLKKQKSDMARRAWNILRLALLWKGKGGVLKNKIIMDLRFVPKYFKNLRHTNNQRGALYYGERELSFDDTPIIHFKMHRPSSLRFLPCIKPDVDFDYDFDFHEDGNEEMYYNDVARKSFLKGTADDEDEEVNDSCDDDEIDLKAEKFIAKFREQMKLQRQISYLQYNEMLNRGAN